MAGGRGSRLMPLTNKIPKPMLKIGESPIIEIILRRLKEQGFQKVYISINYLGDQIQNHVGDGAWLGLSVKYLREKQPLGTAGALSLLKGQIDEPVVVMNSDLLTEANLAQLLSFHIREKVEATVGVREYTVQVPFGVVELKDGKVKEIVEKPTLRSLVSAGIYVLEPSALELVPNNEFCDMPTLIARMHRDNREISAFPIHEAWLDIGRMEDLNEARNLQD
jgi:NDP-sugar pyrophosphorylase family protein